MRLNAATHRTTNKGVLRYLDTATTASRLVLSSRHGWSAKRLCPLREHTTVCNSEV